MSGFKGLEAMDLEKPDFSQEAKGGCLSASSCSICLEPVLDHGGRSIAKLQCSHEFHLDCIGSAFNAKGAMQCPNCRKVEKGRWLYANGQRSADFDLEGWVTEDIYDLSYPELPFGFQWCPFRGFTQLASFIEEGESQANSYNEAMANTAFGDHSSTSSSTHVCPYLALHGFPHAMHSAPTSSADSVPDNGPFHRHSTSLGGQSSADMINSHSSATELRNHEWLQRPSFLFPLSLNADQSSSHLGMRLSRNDTNSQQRLGSFVHPHPLVHGSIARGGSNVVASQLGTPVTGEARGHTRGHGSHIYQQSMSSSTLRSSPFAPVRRMRPRGVALISSVATSSTPEMGSFYGFSVSGSVNRNHQDSENISRHFDRIYGWGREAFTPLPWIPLEGESQWWGPFNPNPNPQSGSFPQRAAAERATQSRPENGYQRMPPPRMPPFI